MEGSHPALPAEPGTLKATLPDTPGIGQMTERESAHPNYQQIEQHPLTNGMASLNVTTPVNTPPQSGEGDGVARSKIETAVTAKKTTGVDSPSPTKQTVNTVSLVIDITFSIYYSLFL